MVMAPTAAAFMSHVSVNVDETSAFCRHLHSARQFRPRLGSTTLEVGFSGDKELVVVAGDSYESGIPPIGTDGLQLQLRPKQQQTGGLQLNLWSLLRKIFAFIRRKELKWLDCGHVLVRQGRKS
ncbi:hypothetical protein Q1695_011684 [Nippostrongylus brasiliensis]|nr:hypothetical protein Q1695_011684 [Nippostrongylus brasiliensis]